MFETFLLPISDLPGLRSSLSLRDHLSAEPVEYGILLKGGYTAHYF